MAKPLGLDVLQGAAGILRIVNTQMAVDLRLALQEQGQDPRKFALVAFGGAGPLHAATLARSVGIPTVLVPPYPGLNCAIGMLQTSVRHSYLKSEVGVLSRFPTQRMNDLFARAPSAGAGGGERGGVCARRREAHPPPRSALPASRLYLAGRVSGRDRRRTTSRGSSRPSTMLHLQVYGQSAPKEDAEIVTFRLQAEIEVPRLELPKLARGDGRAERALKGERPLFDIDANRFVRAKVYDRQKLMAGDGIAGPADHRPVRRHDRGAGRADRNRRRHRHPDHRDREHP